MKPHYPSRLAGEDARQRRFQQLVAKARTAFADVPFDELQKRVDEAVEEVRAKRWGEPWFR